MPTYDYECSACGHTWEMFQQITEGAKRRCPECGRLKARRLIGTGAAVLFRGAGFYETDYRSAEYKKQAKADKEPPAKDAKSSSDSSSSKKTEAKKPQSKAGGKD